MSFDERNIDKFFISFITLHDYYNQTLKAYLIVVLGSVSLRRLGGTLPQNVKIKGTYVKVNCKRKAYLSSG